MQSGDVDELIATLPACPARDELSRLVCVARKFEMRRGRGLDVFTTWLTGVLRAVKVDITFDAVLEELETQAARRHLYGDTVSPVENVNRIMEHVTYWHPKRGRVDMPFATLRNKVTRCKKCIRGNSR